MLYCFNNFTFIFLITKDVEIVRIKAIGDELCKLFEKLEQSMGESHVKYLESAAFKTFSTACTGEFGAKVAEEEAAGVVIFRRSRCYL